MHPECVEPMRKELEAVIGEEGWSKASINKLLKLDSFVKESLRLSPLGTCTFSPKLSVSNIHPAIKSSCYVKR